MTELTELVHQRDLKSIRNWLTTTGTLEIAESISRLEAEQRAIVFRLLPKERSIDVFEMLDPALQQGIIKTMREGRVREILEEMEPDDRARLLDELPPTLAKWILEGLSLKERRLTSILLGYPEHSVGRIMSPEFVTLKIDMTAKEALAKVRDSGRGVEAIYLLPVVDEQEKLVDMIELGDLVLADPTAKLDALVSEEPYSIKANQNQETASRLLLEAGLMALPVVNDQDHLVGILTFDDAMEVLQESDTEDILRAGASEPLGAPYFSASLFTLTRTRAVWLMILALAATLTVNVLNFFQDALQSAITLTLFIPLLIGIGGNIGSQSATIIIRAMALGEVRFSDIFAVILREIRVGFFWGQPWGQSPCLWWDRFLDGK